MDKISVNMDNILNARFGKDLSTITATFKKTVKIREYETEVIEVSSTTQIDENASGIERMLATSLLTGQIEYAAYVALAANGLMPEKELKARCSNIEKDINLVVNKYIALTGEDPSGKYNLV